MNRTILNLCALGAATFLVAAPAAAQIDDRAGTAALEELLVPATPRTVALGHAVPSGLGNMQGVEALQSNPAAVMSNMGTNAMFSRMEYIADIGVNYFGIAQRLGNNNVALTVTSWDYGDIAETDGLEISDVTPDLTYSASTIAVGLTLGRQFTDRIAAGFTVKGMNRQIAESNAPSVAFDAGMTYVVGESGLRFGVSLKNFGTKSTFSGDLDRTITVSGSSGNYTTTAALDAKDDELPSQLNFGAAYTRQFASDFSATALANFRSNAYDLDQYTTGLEVGFQNLVFVRGGYSLTSDNDVDAWDNWNIGAGVNIPVSTTALTIDYAYRPSNVFDSVNMFSVSLTL